VVFALRLRRRARANVGPSANRPVAGFVAEILTDSVGKLQNFGINVKV
jgi:hypothetical protein